MYMQIKLKQGKVRKAKSEGRQWKKHWAALDRHVHVYSSIYTCR